MIYEKDGSYVNPAKRLLERCAKPARCEEIAGILDQGHVKEVSKEELEKIVATAAHASSLSAQMQRIRKEEQAEMLRRMQELAEEYNKKNPLYQRPVVQIGWVCPKCGAVNAPFVSWCPCVPPQVTC